MFPQKTYVERRKVLKEKVGKGLILFFGNEEPPMNYLDNPYHFRQDSTFLYYFGINRPDLTAVIDVDNDSEIVFGIEYTVEDFVVRGPQPSIADEAAKCGVKSVQTPDDLTNMVKSAQQKGQKIHFLPLYRSLNKIKLQELIGVAPAEIEEKASLDLIKAVISQREFKTEEEIVELNNAVDVTVDMHVAAMKYAKAGMKEAEVMAEVYRVAHAAGGDISFPIISTINGQTLHNHYYGNTIKEGDLFLLDAGFENPMVYAGDLSSTFPVSKKFTTEQKEIYELTLASHQAAIDILDVGVPYKKAHIAASTVIFDGLKEMGFTKGNAEDAIEAGAHALFFPCGTGHMMGLDAHDMEDLGEVWVGYEGKPKSTQFGMRSLRWAKPVQPGHVFTIEPGIYFIPELIDLWRSQNKYNEFINWDKVDTYRNFGGIRNEEDFVMTENGIQLLGKKKPMTIEEVEALRV